MKRIVLGLVLATTTAIAAAPAFAQFNNSNCSTSERGSYAQCVIEQSRRTDSGQ